MIDNNLFISKLLQILSFIFQVWGYGTEHNFRQHYRRSLFTFWCFGHSTSRPRDSLKFLSYLSPKPKGRQEKGTKGKGKISNQQIFHEVEDIRKDQKSFLSELISQFSESPSGSNSDCQSDKWCRICGKKTSCGGTVSSPGSWGAHGG